MINENIWHRILYLGSGLVTIVALILAFMVIPSVRMDTSPGATPETAVPALWGVVIVHLLIVATLIWTIIGSKRRGRLKKGLLVAAGVMLLLLCLLVLDGATAYIDQPGMHRVGVSMFICVGCDFIASVLAFTARYLPRHQSNAK